MKRDELIKKLITLGCELVRHRGKHDWYANHQTGQSHYQGFEQIAFQGVVREWT